MKKRIVMMLTFALMMCMSVMADNDRVITFDQLPAPAQTLLKQHFADKVVMIVTVDYDDYTVMYQSGEKVEFDKKLTASVRLFPQRSSLSRSRRT